MKKVQFFRYSLLCIFVGLSLLFSCTRVLEIDVADTSSSLLGNASLSIRLVLPQTNAASSAARVVDPATDFISVHVMGPGNAFHGDFPVVPDTSTGSATVSATIDTLYASEGNTVIIEAWMQPAGDTPPVLLTAGSTAQGEVALVANAETTVSVSMLPVEDNLFVLEIDETGAVTQYGVDLWEYANADRMTFFQVYLPGNGEFILGFDTTLDFLELSSVDLLLYEADGRRVPPSPSGYTVSKTASVSRESPCRITISDGTPRYFIVGIPAQPAETAINYFVDVDFQAQLALPVFADLDGAVWTDDNEPLQISVNAPIVVENITIVTTPVSGTAPVLSNFEGGVLTLTPPEGEYWQSGAYLSLEMIDAYYYRYRSLDTDSLNGITALVFVDNNAAAESGNGTRNAPYASLAEAEVEISVKTGESMLPVQVLLAASASEYILSGTTGFAFNYAPAHFSGGWNTDFSAAPRDPEATKINAGTTGIAFSVASEVFPEGLRNLSLYTDGVVLDGIATGYNHALVAVMGSSSAQIRDCIFKADNIDMYADDGSSTSFSLIHFETTGIPVLANSKLQMGTARVKSVLQLSTFYLAALGLGSERSNAVIILGNLLDAGTMQWEVEPSYSGQAGMMSALSLGNEATSAFVANNTLISGAHSGITSGFAQGAAAVAGYAAADYHFVNNIFAVTPTIDGKTTAFCVAYPWDYELYITANYFYNNLFSAETALQYVQGGVDGETGLFFENFHAAFSGNEVSNLFTGVGGLGFASTDWAEPAVYTLSSASYQEARENGLNLAHTDNTNVFPEPFSLKRLMILDVLKNDIFGVARDNTSNTLLWSMGYNQVN